MRCALGKVKRRLLSTAILVALILLAAWMGPEIYRQSYAAWRLESADVAADVELAVARNDRRFMGYTRYGLVVPGLFEAVGTERARELEERYGVMRIWGISCTEGHGRYGEAAHRYSERYNLILLAKLGVRVE